MGEVKDMDGYFDLKLGVFYLYVGQGDDHMGETGTYAWAEIMVLGIRDRSYKQC